MQQKLLDQAMNALKAGQFTPALAAMDLYAQKGPMMPLYYKVRGLAELGISDWKAAAETFGAAVKKYRDNHDLWAHLGLAQQYMGETDAAIASFERALKLKSDNGVASANLANLFRTKGRYAEAEKLAEHGARHHPDRAWAENILGLIYFARSNFDKAEARFRASLALLPNDPHATLNLTNNFVGARNFDAAWPLFAEAQRLSPSPTMRMGEALARLQTGDFEKGWRLYESRLEYASAKLYGTPVGKPYRGEDVRSKKIYVMWEQGFGDVIQFCRFGALLEKAGAEISWQVQKQLYRLLAPNLPGKTYPMGEGPAEADYYIPIMSLPLALGCMTPETWPQSPYLKAPSNGPQLPDAGTGPKIGLVWAGAAGHEKNFYRTMQLFEFDGLLGSVPAQFYAPFLGDALGQIENRNVAHLDHLINDFADTAALMQQMDAVVTVDTSAAHLAGALGVRTFLLLPSSPEWRWGLSGDTTPWYKNMTVLRQEKFGDWGAVMQELAGFLGKL